MLNQFDLHGYPEILLVSNVVENGKPIGLGDAGRHLHSDLSYKPLPGLGAMLLTRELPEEGGERCLPTWFVHTKLCRLISSASSRAAAPCIRMCIARSDCARCRPGRRRARKRSVTPLLRSIPPAVHTHRETSKRALFVNEGFTSHITGLPDEESTSVLDAGAALRP